MKKIMAIFLVSVMVLSSIAVKPVTSEAKVKMPDKSEKLLDHIAEYATLYIIYEPKKTWTKMQMNNDTYFDTLSVLRYEYASEKQLRKSCYNHFGKKGYKNITTGGYFEYNERGTISNLLSGDWGCEWPIHKITKKKKIKSGTYDVYVMNYTTILDCDTKSTLNEYEKRIIWKGEKCIRIKHGESIIRIKKNKKSAFGYVVTGIKYRTTNKKDYEERKNCTFRERNRDQERDRE